MDNELWRFIIFITTIITHTETAMADRVSGIATRVKQLKVYWKIHGKAAAIPTAIVKTAILRW